MNLGLGAFSTEKRLSAVHDTLLRSSRKILSTPTGQSGKHCCLLFPSRSHVVPCSFLNPSSCDCLRWGKGCFGSADKTKFKQPSCRKISTHPIRATSVAGGSIFPPEGLVFKKISTPRHGQKVSRGVVFFQKNLFDVCTRHPVSLTKATVRGRGRLEAGDRETARETTKPRPRSK